jgi:hypothetical protein
MPGTNRGRFVWYELMTTDPSAAIAFYGEVAGWKTEPWKDGYTMFAASQGPLGGVMAKPGQQPAWTGNVVVDDVDAAAAVAQKRGGRVAWGPEDIPEVGRVALLADPQGALISVFKPVRSDAPLRDDTKAGEFDWHELVTDDKAAAFAFYSELFGWKKIEEHDMGPMGTYLIYGIGDKQLGGMFTKVAEMKAMPTAWQYYVNVADIDAATKRVASNGGKVLRGPMPVPGGTRITQCLDPQGAAFALHGGASHG